MPKYPLRLYESEGDPGCIFFTLNTHQTTFISDILSYDCRNWSLFLDTQKHRTDGRTDRRWSWNSYLNKFTLVTSKKKSLTQQYSNLQYRSPPCLPLGLTPDLLQDSINYLKFEVTCTNTDNISFLRGVRMVSHFNIGV